MTRVLLCCVLLGACSVFQRPAESQARVDTVTVTQTVEPPLPEGDSTGICLSTGVTALVHIAANGDTLIGEKRIPLSQLRPALTFPGVYAGELEWFRRGDVVSFDRRNYRRAGVARIRACDEMKLVGQHQGVPIFAEVTAPQILPMIIIPVRPGLYQDYLRAR
jgi:hypothetical protein